MKHLVISAGKLTMAALVACAVACGGTGTRQTATDAKSGEPLAAANAGAATNSGNAIAAEILRQIRSDPKITGKDIQVTFEPRTATSAYDSMKLTGTVATDDERVAAEAHAQKLTDMVIFNSLSVVPAPSAETDDMKAGAWTDPDSGTKPAFPLCAGLTIVTAIASQGDYESIKTIESMTPTGVRVKYSAESAPPWWSSSIRQLNKLITHRTVLTSDLESAHRYAQIFVGTKYATETAPGTTAIGTSAAVLRALKMEGETEISFCAAADDTLVMGADGREHPVPGGCRNFTDPFTIERVGTGPVRLRVLVDGAPTDLPAVQAQGKTGYQERVEFFFLDDERNPLTLAFRLGIGEMGALNPKIREMCETYGKKGILVLDGPMSCDLPDGGDRETLRVIKITTRCDAPMAASAGSSEGGAGAVPGGAAGSGADALEKALAETGTVDVYSIYFSFNSDVLREESEPTLKDIAAVLRRHPDWRLRVTGHTDGIGSDQFNLDLSRRRAATVKDALLKRHGIDPGRLDTAGFGESQPRDTNDTLEGRARNRRVELVRRGI